MTLSRREFIRTTALAAATAAAAGDLLRAEQVAHALEAGLSDTPDGLQ